MDHRQFTAQFQHVSVESWQPYLRWSHVANTGGVFGMFQGTTTIFAVLAGLVTLMIVWMNYSSKESTLLARGVYGLILGGALGNLLDRIRIGHVTDFIDIDLSSIIPIGIADWYVFNVADMAIIGGIITLLILSFVAPAKINLDG